MDDNTPSLDSYEVLSPKPVVHLANINYPRQLRPTNTVTQV